MPLVFLAAIYLLLLWISIFNMALAFVMFNRSIGLLGLGAALIFPLLPGRLSEMCAVLFVLVGDHLRRIAAR